MSIDVSLRELFRLVLVDNLRRARNVGFLVERLIYFDHSKNATVLLECSTLQTV